MSTTETLSSFVKEGLVRGVSREDLRAALDAAGWRPAEVRAALGAYADVSFPVPVPRRQVASAMSARDAFLYLVLFSTLYVVSFNVGSLLFAFVDHWLPDPGFTAPPATLTRAIRWSVSALIAATPVFALVAWITTREVRQDPVRRTSAVRRWLTYLTLFLAAGVIVGDVTGLVYNLLGGELTTRFLLKALIVGGIAGTVFVYYLTDVRAGDVEGDA